VSEALSRRAELGVGGLAVAKARTWDQVAALTLAAYREVAR